MFCPEHGNRSYTVGATCAGATTTGVRAALNPVYLVHVVDAVSSALEAHDNRALAFLAVKETERSVASCMIGIGVGFWEEGTRLCGIQAS